MASPRAGFSLIELLIVVAIIAALVGVAVPFFQDNLAEANRAKAREDIEVIRKAIERYEALEGAPLSGTRLEPLLGRYLQELPVDPWGNPYLWDGSAGVLLSYGADALPGGSGGDADVMRFERPSNSPIAVAASIETMPVFMRRVQYQGPWGPPQPPPPNGFLPDFAKFELGNKFVISFTRPIDEVGPADLPAAVEIYFDGTTDSSHHMDSTTWVASTWMSAATPFLLGFGKDPGHRPEVGQLVLRATKDNLRAAGGARAPIRPSMRMGLALANLDAAVVTSWTANGDPASPLDPAVYGAEASRYRPLLFPAAPSEGNLDGVRIERY